MTRQFAAPMDASQFSESLKRRFWDKVTKGEPDECWEWTGSRTSRGYGRIRHDTGTVVTASRVSLAMKLGALEENVSACHTCDNPPCVNPAHLFAGTQSVNAIDSVAKGRANRARGEATHSAKLTEEQVMHLRSLPYYRGFYTDMGREYGVAAGTIRNAYLGILWQCARGAA